MLDELAKLASSLVLTHYPKSQVDAGFLGRLTAEFFGNAEDARVVDEATTRGAYEVSERNGTLSPGAHRLCGQAAEVVERFNVECGRRMRARVVVVDFMGKHVIAATEVRWVTWQSQ